MLDRAPASKPHNANSHCAGCRSPLNTPPGDQATEGPVDLCVHGVIGGTRAIRGQASAVSRRVAAECSRPLSRVGPAARSPSGTGAKGQPWPWCVACPTAGHPARGQTFAAGRFCQLRRKLDDSAGRASACVDTELRHSQSDLVRPTGEARSLRHREGLSPLPRIRRGDASKRSHGSSPRTRP